jgi:tRNA dimethylallyltransferase
MDHGLWLWTIDHGPLTFIIFPKLEERKKTLIVVVGPTAVGKTAAAIRIAQEFHTEVISADSRQIFKELTIGTAKPSEQELSSVPHHFVDSHSINDTYDAAQYGRDALSLITKLFESHDYLVLCGGSGLYIKAICDGFDDIPDVPVGIREMLMQHYEQHGIEWLQREVERVDPEHFNTIDQKNPHRLIRALEVKLGTGSSIASFRKRKTHEHFFNILKIGLELPREELYERIDERMDKMIDAGLFEEAAALYPFRDRQALQTVGYQEIFDFIDGKYDREEAVRLLKRNSRRYAKRQLTWFKRDKEVHWFSPGNPEELIQFVKSRQELLGEPGGHQ